MADNEALLKEIRERYQYHKDAWSEIRKEAATDMKFLSGDPWPAEEKAARKNNRPVIALDELNQYLNQLVNGARQTRRAIKVSPRGNGATDETAEFRGGLIRQIEYKSNAQSAYLTALESCASRSYGFYRISKRYVSDSEFDQELVIKRIPNPDTISLDPDASEVDASDMDDAFVIERFSAGPKAEKRSFSEDLIQESSGWISQKDIQVAEYWKREAKRRQLLLLDGGGQGTLKLFADELAQEHAGLTILRQRPVETFTVVQRITNGVEILEEKSWDGKYIPIVPMYGKELWFDDGGGSKRRLFSLVRLARDPYMLYCYYRACQMEVVGQVPKVPYIGYEGQFEGHEDEWNKVNKVPLGY